MVLYFTYSGCCWEDGGSPYPAEMNVTLLRSCLAKPITCFKVLTSSEVLFRLLARSIEAALIDAADWRFPYMSIWSFLMKLCRL
jgi:hypothetical protein